MYFCALDYVEIGDGCLFASHVYISNNSHGRYSGDISESSPVKIGKNVWICQGVVINPGVTIGEGSVVGANSVVTHSIPPYSIAVGTPAKVIKYYDFTRACWVKQ